MPAAVSAGTSGISKITQGKGSKKEGGKLPQITWDNEMFFLLRFAHFSKFSMYACGKKRKLLVFTAVYVCVKAKLTLVRFFFNFFFAPFP